MMQEALRRRVSDSKLILFCGLSWLLAGLLPAFLAYRFFYADGAYFFMWILDKKEVLFAAEGRSLTYVITQWPAVAAAAAGCRNIKILAWCFGAGYILLLLGIHASSLVILCRRGMKCQAAVLMIMIWLIMGYGGLFTITDCHTPAAVFLLAVVLMTSPVPISMRHLIVLCVIGVSSLLMYEFWAFYSAILIAVLAWRLWPHWHVMTRRDRWACILLVCLFAASVVVNFRRMLCTSVGSNRDSLLSMLLGTTYPIYLGMIGVWFAGLCGHILICVRPELCRALLFLPRERIRVRMLLFSFTALVLLCAIQHNTMIRYSYPFRTLNLALPFVFACWVMAMGRKNMITSAPRAVRMLLVVVTIFLIASENWMTAGWRNYWTWAGDVEMASGSIFVAQEPTTPVSSVWIFPWNHSAHSFVSQALRSGRVRGIAYDPAVAWSPYGRGYEDSVRSIAADYGVELP